MRLSEKLGALCATAAIVPLIAASFVLFYWVSSNIRENADRELQRDSRAAASIHRKRLGEMLSVAQRLADDIANRALPSGEKADRDGSATLARLQDMLPGAQNEHSLDFVVVTDPQGRVVARHNDRPAPGETLLGAEDKNLIAEKVISDGAQLRNLPAASSAVERAVQLDRLGLKNLARVDAPDGTAVVDALVLEAAAPIFAAKRFIGIVLIGQVLNNYYRPRPGSSVLQVPLVAEVQQTLYARVERDAGALIALGDTVITSSVPATGSAGEPPLKGVRCRPEKAEEALSTGDRSYAVSWQAIKSIQGEQVGALGVAVSNEELRGPISTLRTMLFAITALACVLTGAGGFIYGRALGTRVSILSEAASRMSLGELSTPVRDPGQEQKALASIRRDEISNLADQLDQARESFRLAIDRLRKKRDEA
jgi:HAMP domain-containing protein